MITINYSQSPVMYKTSIEQKNEARNAAHKIKFGSPKLRDVLREKCRTRIKEARQSNFMKNRDINEENIKKKNLINIIIREELQNSEDFINESHMLQELVLNEFAEEMNEWLMKDIEEFENEFINIYNDEQMSVFCPICQKYELYKDNEYLKCRCGIKFHFKDTLEHFNYIISTNVNMHHEMKCTSSIRFFIEPVIDNNITYLILNGLCNACDFLFVFNN